MFLMVFSALLYATAIGDLWGRFSARCGACRIVSSKLRLRCSRRYPT